MKGRPGRRCAPPTFEKGEDDIDGSGGVVGDDDGVSDDDYSDDDGDHNDDDDDDAPVGRVGRPRHHLAHRVVHLSGTRRVGLL